MIKAIGIKNGERMEVLVEKDGVLFNGRINKALEIEYNTELKTVSESTVGREPYTCTENVYEMLSGAYFFDQCAISVETDEEIEKLPYDPDLIY